MPINEEICHSATVIITVPCQTALAYLTDPIALGNWTLGSRNIQYTDSAQIYQGESLFDGSRTLLRIDAYPEHGLIDYAVGSSPRQLAMRISVRVLDGAAFGFGSERSLITLTAWRPAAMDDARWQRLCACHEVEILLLKEQLENHRSHHSSP